MDNLNVLILIGVTLFSVFGRHQPFDMNGFGTTCENMMLGAAAVHIGGGAGIWLKQDTEPGTNRENTKLENLSDPIER